MANKFATFILILVVLISFAETKPGRFDYYQTTNNTEDLLHDDLLEPSTVGEPLKQTTVPTTSTTTLRPTKATRTTSRVITIRPTSRTTSPKPTTSQLFVPSPTRPVRPVNPVNLTKPSEKPAIPQPSGEIIVLRPVFFFLRDKIENINKYFPSDSDVVDDEEDDGYNDFTAEYEAEYSHGPQVHYQEAEEDEEQYPQYIYPEDDTFNRRRPTTYNVVTDDTNQPKIKRKFILKTNQLYFVANARAANMPH